METLVEYLGKGFMVMLSVSLPCVLMAALVGFQSLVNISVASGLLPNTGLP